MAQPVNPKRVADRRSIGMTSHLLSSSGRRQKNCGVGSWNLNFEAVEVRRAMRIRPKDCMLSVIRIFVKSVEPEEKQSSLRLSCILCNFRPAQQQQQQQQQYTETEQAQEEEGIRTAITTEWRASTQRHRFLAFVRHFSLYIFLYRVYWIRDTATAVD